MNGAWKIVSVVNQGDTIHHKHNVRLLRPCYAVRPKPFPVQHRAEKERRRTTYCMNTFRSRYVIAAVEKGRVRTHDHEQGSHPSAGHTPVTRRSSPTTATARPR
eukprot:1888270-Prymnesium_polylepis.1